MSASTINDAGQIVGYGMVGGYIRGFLLTPLCGNGIPAGGEQCDDGNTTNGDGCSALCAIEPGYTCLGTPSACSRMVFWQSFVVKDPLPGVDPSRRRVTVLGREPLSDDILVGNPIVNGATVQIIAHGGR